MCQEQAELSKPQVLLKKEKKIKVQVKQVKCRDGDLEVRNFNLTYEA